MKITFTHSKKKTEISVFAPSEAKFYAVSKDYSDDGYYAGIWNAQELEPVPACAVQDTELLAHVRVNVQGGGTAVLEEVFCKEGVKYAAD